MPPFYNVLKSRASSAGVIPVPATVVPASNRSRRGFAAGRGLRPDQCRRDFLCPGPSVTIASMKLARYIAIVLIPLLLASAHANDQPDLQTILDAWKAREKNTQSFELRWRSKHFEDASSPRALEASEGKTPTPIPDATHIIQYRYLTDALGRARCEDIGKQWAPDKADFVPRSHVEVFDGKSVNTQYLPGQAGYPVAFLNEKTRAKTGEHVWMMPLNLVYRPLSRVGSLYDPTKLALAQESANDGLLILGDDNGKVWVDPAKDFLPTRYNQNHVGRNGVRMEITYSRKSDQSWVPDTWIVEMVRSNEKVYMAESAKAIEISINKPIADSEFELDLSGGSFVSDNLKDGEYILRPDGTRRRLKPDELNDHNYEELLKSEPDSK